MKQSIVISIGDELTSGRVCNSNAAFIARIILKKGIINRKIIVIPDNKDDIINALRASDQYDFVFVTGGLGPTHDDITKKVVADYFNTELVENELLRAELEAFFKERNIEISEINYEQALFPEKGEIVPNDIGTAAGIHIKENRTDYYFLPGVPAEMELMLEKYIGGKLEQDERITRTRYEKIRTFGIAESRLYSRLQKWIAANGEVRVSFLPQMPGVDIFLESEKYSAIDQAREFIDDNFAEYIFGYNDDSPYEILGNLLREQNLSIAVAESCTGGLIGHSLTNRSGSSTYFKGGIVAYSNQIKIERLGVNKTTIEKYGAVSRSTAREMAEGVKKIFNVDLGISTTGIAGPTGGTKEKPVGTLWFGLAGDETKTFKFSFNKNRVTNKKAFAKFALIRTIQYLNRRTL
jgi:nicotinamide-nucleotide amidase